MGYGITSKSQIIDKGQIKEGCSQLRKAAESFTTAGDDIKDTSKKATKKVFSIDGKAIDKDLEAIGNEVKKGKETIDGVASAIESEAEKIYNAQCKEYQDYLDSQKDNG